MDRDPLLFKLREVNQAVRAVLLIEEPPPDPVGAGLVADQKLNLGTRKGGDVRVTMIQNQVQTVVNTRVVNILGLLDELQDLVLAANDATRTRSGQIGDDLRAGLVITAALALDQFMTIAQAQAALKVAIVDEALKRYPSQCRTAHAIGMQPANLGAFLRTEPYKQLTLVAKEEEGG